MQLNMWYHPRSQCLLWRLNSMRSSYNNIEKDSKLTAGTAGYCCWKCLMVNSSAGCYSNAYQKYINVLSIAWYTTTKFREWEARKKLGAYFSMLWYKGLKYTRDLSQRNKEKFCTKWCFFFVHYMLFFYAVWFKQLCLDLQLWLCNLCALKHYNSWRNK